MTHEERMVLVHRPFFITYIGPSYLWAGVAVVDHFYEDGRWAERPRPHDQTTTIGITPARYAGLGEFAE